LSENSDEMTGSEGPTRFELRPEDVVILDPDEEGYDDESEEENDEEVEGLIIDGMDE
jgi:hypothetical protein